MKLLVRIALVLSLFAALLAACAPQKPSPVEYSIVMDEFSYTPNTIEVQVGQEVTLKLVNRGALEHEIMFGRDVMMMNNLPDGFQHDLFADAGVEPMVMGGGEAMGEEAHDGEADHAGFMVVLPKTGDEASLTFTVTDEMVGEWDIGCFLQEGVHYNAGMKGTLVVKP